MHQTSESDPPKGLDRILTCEFNLASIEAFTSVGKDAYIYIYGSPPPPGTDLFQFYTLFTVFKASPVKGFEGTGIPYSL